MDAISERRRFSHLHVISYFHTCSRCVVSSAHTSDVDVMCYTIVSQMRDTLERVVAMNPVPHFVFCAGLAIGSVFTSHDMGRFLTGGS